MGVGDKSIAMNLHLYFSEFKVRSKLGKERRHELDERLKIKFDRTL